jgi:NTP pyrophosphatase (non-canonical NTP hydrolase)
MTYYNAYAQITPIEYQEQIVELSKNYNIYGTDKALPTYSHGLSEEVGEVMGLLKRYYRGDVNEELGTKLKLELGDVLAYLILVAHTFDISLEEIMLANIDKINRRKTKGTLTGTGSER